jgi:hypothetical protein
MGHLLKLRYALGTPECAYFSCNKSPIETHDGANAKFSTNFAEKAYSVGLKVVTI